MKLRVSLAFCCSLWDSRNCFQQNCNIWWGKLKWAKRQTKPNVSSFLCNKNQCIAKRNRIQSISDLNVRMTPFMQHRNCHWIYRRRIFNDAMNLVEVQASFPSSSQHTQSTNHQAKKLINTANVLFLDKLQK